MPKSKRARVVTLSKTKKHGRRGKERLVADIRECVETYEHIYTFTVENMRTSVMKDVRLHFRSSKFFMGKNKVMQFALGRTHEEEMRPQLSRLTQRIVGSCGLLFTDEPKESVIEFFSNLEVDEFPRCGFKCQETIEATDEMLAIHPIILEPQLRSLGMPVHISEGKILLTKPYTICSEDEVLTSDKARLLRHFNFRLAKFQLHLSSHWTGDEYEELDG